ncbi:ACT domain-containing protein [Paraglaciecola chathamensis]|uniref:ACT domain-containing protein n=1 Tax=Paraglaciecola chathamensis TaxID=368405 RepID=UPI00271061E0|nr:ACT domain-containing protein [Paraglaciecola chathamensis]MDO6561419.1 ACT domain-containing protein [Paraglaciecola chathamensis]|tara:strand:- start:985 stop:1377 length:393 start_codon:yes stop_codon:yes gene_type:complete
MSGITELTQLLSTMSPHLQDGEYAFCTTQGNVADYMHLNPVCFFQESEGLTLILLADVAKRENIPFDGTYKQITLTVHSSLEAVGLTAAVANKLTQYGISANVVAAYYHDHIFVPSAKATLAMKALAEFA